MSGEAPRPPGAEVLRLVHPEAPATRPPGAARADPDAWTLHLGLHPQASVAGSEPGALRLTQVDGAEIRLDWEQPALGRALAALVGDGLSWRRWIALCAGLEEDEGVPWPGEGAPASSPQDGPASPKDEPSPPQAEPAAPPQADPVAPPEGDPALAEAARAALERLRRGRLLAWWLGAPGLRAVELAPIRAGYAPLAEVPARLDLRLPEGAAAARGPHGLMLEIPDLDATVTFSPEGLALLGPLMGHGRPGAPPMPPMARQVFAAAGLLRPAPVPGSAEAAAEADWTVWDRLAHRLTRDTHRLTAPVPGMPARPPAVRRPAPPPAWTRPGLPRVALPRPGPETPSRPLAEVLESRRSHRLPGRRPLDLAAIGTLLWRIARRRPDREDPGTRPVAKNLPGGGASGDVSIYLAAGRCLGLPRGFYGYDDRAHALVRFPDAPSVGGVDPLAATLDYARGAMLAEAPPDAVITVAWRPGALAPRYAFNAYRLGLLHAGVTVLGLTLAAEDLGLAGCPVGAGEHRLFALLAGADPRVETSLVEFALSARDDAAAAAGPAAPPGA
ncbi:MAG: SagB family peptide dehydrogenase [Albimonas sp.]|uniref:SagB family peptide dehydrogenase n=1 Tax=Albimonas sp. TaxID=1872425 RepID=UPI004056DC1A